MSHTRHDARKYDTQRRLPTWQDRRGEKVERLLITEWVGWWHGRPYWKAVCDCGRETVVRWGNNMSRSCGCLLRDMRKARDLRSLAIDGSWRIAKSRQVELPDGRRFASMNELAREIGIGRNAIAHRLKHWPPERWTEPPKPSGKGQKHRKLLNKAWHARRTSHKPQPWAAELARTMTRRNRERRASREEETS